jgi:hypothetical protein
VDISNQVTNTVHPVTCIAMLDSLHVIHIEHHTLAILHPVHTAHNQLVADQIIYQSIHTPVNHHPTLAVVTGSASFKTTMHHTHHTREQKNGTQLNMLSHQPKRLENHLDHNTDENDEMTMTVLMPITSQTNKNQSNLNTKINTPSCQENRLVDGVTINHKTMSVLQNAIMDMHFLVLTCPFAESQPKVGLFHQQLGATATCHQLNTVQHHILATDTMFAKRRAMDMATVTDMVTDMDMVTDTVMDTVTVMDTDTIMAENAVMMAMIEVNTTATNTKETNMVTDMDTATHTLSITDSSNVVFDATPDSDQLMADGPPVVIKTMVSGRFHIPTASRK